jgi:hypothetical protein
MSLFTEVMDYFTILGHCLTPQKICMDGRDKY